MVVCPNCGEENEENAEVCRKCGIGLEDVHKPVDREEEEPASTLIILGYILAVLGYLSFGILAIASLVIGVILRQKDYAKAKTHGLIIIILSIIVLILVILTIYLFLGNPSVYSNLNPSVARFMGH